jgi:hypothetical protein
MDYEIVSDYRHAVFNIEGKHYQSAEKNFIKVLKCLTWSTVLTYVTAVDEAYREKFSKMKYVIQFIGLDQPHREKIGLLRARCFSKEEQAEVFSIIRDLSRYFEEETKKKQTDISL